MNEFSEYEFAQENGFRAWVDAWSEEDAREWLVRLPSEISGNHNVDGNHVWLVCPLDPDKWTLVKVRELE